MSYLWLTDYNSFYSPKYRGNLYWYYAYILSTLVTETLRTLGHHMGQKPRCTFLGGEHYGQLLWINWPFSTQHPQQLLGTTPLSWGPELLRVLLGLAVLFWMAHLGFKIWVWRAPIREGFPDSIWEEETLDEMESRIFPLTRLFLVGQAQMMWAATSPTSHKTQTLWSSSNLSWTQRGHGDCYFDGLCCFQVFVGCDKLLWEAHPTIYKNVPRSHRK